MSCSLTEIITIPMPSMGNVNDKIESLFIILSDILFLYFFIQLNKRMKNNGFKFNAQRIIFFILCFSILIFSLNSHLSTLMKKSLIMEAYFFTQFQYLVMLLTMIILIYLFIHKEYQLSREHLKQKQLSNYIAGLEKTNEEMRHFHHDYANILFTLQGFIENEDIQGLKHYFQSHILKADKQLLHTHKAFSNLQNLLMTELKGLIASKLLIAKQLGVNVHLEIPEEIQSIPVDVIDLTRIIGILMDNAIEASEKSTSKEVQMGFIRTNTSILFVIKNTFNELPDMNRLFQAHYSTKGEGRGIGLVNVRKLIQKYPNATMNTRIEQEWFIQEIEFR